MNIDDELNQRQAEAVKTTEGPVLVLAGAGTGKTRVITYRIAHLILDKGIDPTNILAVTFTNKAAEEMKIRLKELTGDLSDGINMGTFHSMSLKILRNEAPKIGLTSGFGIADQEDRLAIIKQAVKDLNIDHKEFTPKMYLHFISSFKNTINYVNEGLPNDDMFRLRDVYNSYQNLLYGQRTVDFDDMISLAVRLFQNNTQVLDEYRNKFKYILVDEYQDTNDVQFQLLFMLAGISGNICVVGDDDQAIYGWRGAEVKNILDFDKVFDNVKEIKLEGNYRSGQSILSIANSLIKHNNHRRGKTLEASSNKNATIQAIEFKTDRDEAEIIANIINDLINNGEKLSDIAILYRTNAQSRNFENTLNHFRIKYKVIGGIGFYQRKEIKDILSYLKVLDNPYDANAFRRSVRFPPRGVGDATVDKIINLAMDEDSNMNIIDVLEQDLKPFARFRNGINSYLNVIYAAAQKDSLKDKIDSIVKTTNYKEYLNQYEDHDDADRKIDNLMELYNAAVAFEEEFPEGTLSDFLATTVLLTSEDDNENDNETVKLMTMHASKGLEFKIVFLTGLEEGLFPLPPREGEDNLQEERRLCYVGITRAMEKLFITRAATRLKNGNYQDANISRFLSELNKGNIKVALTAYNKQGTVNAMEKRRSEYTPPESATFENSTVVSHPTLGEGVVLFSLGEGENERCQVHFKKDGIKKIYVSYLTKVRDPVSKSDKDNNKEESFDDEDSNYNSDNDDY